MAPSSFMYSPLAHLQSVSLKLLVRGGIADSWHPAVPATREGKRAICLISLFPEFWGIAGIPPGQVKGEGDQRGLTPHADEAHPYIGTHACA